MFRKKVTSSVLSIMLAASTAATYAEEDKSEYQKLEDMGVSIGRMSDSPYQDKEEVQLSEAEILLWDTDQLKNISKPSVIRYEFERSSQLEDGFTDFVELDVYKIREDGMKSAAVTFFTGDRNQQVPPNENTNGNPVLGIYLQGDVYEMNRLTEGNWRYFHRRIKFALSEAAEVKPVSFTFDGKEYQGKQVTFAPYVNDPKRKLFEEYADKVYEVIVSDEIPGALYQIKTTIPAVKGQEEKGPVVEEVLVFAGVDLT